MEEGISQLTVLFEEPFWVGLYERENGGSYEVCKVTFGAEPRDNEVYEYFLKNWHSLRFSPPQNMGKTVHVKLNPKRLRRNVRKAVEHSGIGTKAQQALKLQQEQRSIQRKEVSKEALEAEKLRLRELRVFRKKEKHKGH